MALADDEERLSLDPREVTRHEGKGEAQGRRLVALGFRRDLVRSPEREAVTGKPRIDMRDSQGQRLDAEGVGMSSPVIAQDGHRNPPAPRELVCVRLALIAHCPLSQSHPVRTVA